MKGQDGPRLKTRDTYLPRGGVGKGWGEGDKKRGTEACGGEGAQRKEQGLGKKGRISSGTIYSVWETGPAGLPSTFFTIPTRTQGSTGRRGESGWGLQFLGCFLSRASAMPSMGPDTKINNWLDLAQPENR